MRGVGEGEGEREGEGEERGRLDPSILVSILIKEGGEGEREEWGPENEEGRGGFVRSLICLGEPIALQAS